jgi:CheY-like chemotaxis protein
MREEELSTLFDEYSRFNKIANRKTEGTGLGMNIAGRLVKLMDGTITVSSEFGKGSDFTVILPQKNIYESDIITPIEKALLCSFSYHSEAKSYANTELISMPYGSVLVVDDVETNLIVSEGLLSPYKLKIEMVSSGKAAIEKVKNGAVYDIIFMDHMMPEMDGIEATDILRKLGYSKPIIALTANAVSGQKQMFLENGFDDFISKPIDTKVLDKILMIFIHDKHTQKTADTEKVNAEIKASKQVTSKQNESNIPQRIIDAFLRDADRILEAMPKLLENGDINNLGIYAHGIKSGLLNIGENECSDIAKSIEFAAKEDNTEKIEAIFPSFIAQLEKITEKLRSQSEKSKSETITADASAYLPFINNAIDACEKYDNSIAKQSLDEILKFRLSPEVKELIERANLFVFHAEFEEAAAILKDLHDLCDEV